MPPWSQRSSHTHGVPSQVWCGLSCGSASSWRPAPRPRCSGAAKTPSYFRVYDWTLLYRYYMSGAPALPRFPHKTDRCDEELRRLSSGFGPALFNRRCCGAARAPASRRTAAGCARRCVGSMSLSNLHRVYHGVRPEFSVGWQVLLLGSGSYAFLMALDFWFGVPFNSLSCSKHTSDHTADSSHGS